MQDFVKKYPLIFHLFGWIGIAVIFFIIFPLNYRINLLLLTFIENAFQYGISTTKDCEICLKINVENGLLILETTNEIFDNKRINRSKNIGIQNTLKRLEIMFPSNYEYVGKIESNVYKCLLKIKLK